MKERNKQREQAKKARQKSLMHSQPQKSYATSHKGRLRMPAEKITSYKYFKEETRPSFTFEKYMKQNNLKKLSK